MVGGDYPGVCEGGDYPGVCGGGGDSEVWRTSFLTVPRPEQLPH